jgi:hypothetical protein
MERCRYCGRLLIHPIDDILNYVCIDCKQHKTDANDDLGVLTTKDLKDIDKADEEKHLK